MIRDDYDGQMTFGDLGAQSFLTFVLQVWKNPEKTSPRKLVPTGDQTRAHCMTGAHATTCSTEVDKMEVGYDARNWMNLAQDWDKWQSSVTAAMNLWVPQKPISIRSVIIIIIITIN